MKNQIIFKKGQKVMVSQGSNASDFNMHEDWDIMSAYSIKNWEEKEFEIEGTVKLITFKYSPNVYGAYLLKYNGVKVGYIYNTGIKISEECQPRAEIRDIVAKAVAGTMDLTAAIDAIVDLKTDK